MDISIYQIREAVANWANSHPEIESVFLFGSRARGDCTPDSDIDLAVVVAGILGESADTRYFCHRNTWKTELESLLGRSINIVRKIKHGKPEIQESIARDGVLLYEKSSS